MTIGVLGILGSVVYSLNNTKRLREINLKSPYKKVIEVDSKISKIKYATIETLLGDPNGSEKLLQLNGSYNELSKEREKLLQDPKIISLEKKRDYIIYKGFRNTPMIGFGGFLLYLTNFFIKKKKD